MSNVLQKVLLFSSIAAFMILAGGLVALLSKPGENMRSFMLHFAAGVIFSVVAVELLPHIIRYHSGLMAVGGFVAGFLLMIGIRRLTESAEDAGKSAAGVIPWGLLVAIAIDIFIDGLLLGVGFAAGETEGMLLALALSIELLSLGIATATELRNDGTSGRRAIGILAGLAAIFFTSSFLGASLLYNLSQKANEFVLSFGLAALLFLVTEELLREAHEVKETVWHTAAFFGGFLLFMMLGMYS